jgi:hypothetical protein
MLRARCGVSWKSTILLGMLAATTAGCAALAVKPDTPADDMTIDELERDPAPANERYYMLIFGSESEPKRAKYTHSWSTVARVVNPGNGQPPCIEQHTISWMPATLDIHPLRFRVEPGTNLDLATTIRVMLANDERISLWGPYEIRRGLYRKAVIQKEFMESGRIGYQCIDTIGEAARNGNGSDCIHAMTDMDSKFDRGNYPLSKFGDKASEHVVKQVIDRHGIIDPCTTHDWLLGPLGIANCPIVRREDDGRRTRREIMSANRANADQGGR